MADSYVQVPTDGSGKKLDTRTESTNSEHREVHVIGDPTDNDGTAAVLTPADNTATGKALAVMSYNMAYDGATWDMGRGIQLGQTTKANSLPVTIASDQALETLTVATSGASALTVLSAAGASVKNKIFKMVFTVSAAGTLTISDGFGAFYLPANGVVAMDFGDIGKLQTTSNTAVTATNSGGGNVSAHGTYTTV